MTAEIYLRAIARVQKASGEVLGILDPTWSVVQALGEFLHVGEIIADMREDNTPENEKHWARVAQVVCHNAVQGYRTAGPNREVKADFLNRTTTLVSKGIGILRGSRHNSAFSRLEEANRILNGLPAPQKKYCAIQ
jgi:hypothetical protein